MVDCPEGTFCTTGALKEDWLIGVELERFRDEKGEGFGRILFVRLLGCIDGV
tara:strand:+ start:498 stop:653 length:156 start_codon:yes stop_codon:yes gene_type:complete